MHRIGVLALQGDFREHSAMLQAAGAQPMEVRHAADLLGLNGIIIPGGESTAIGRLARKYELLEPLRDEITNGLPAFGTCAGLIFMAERLTEGDQDLLRVLDVTVQRNAFGRQNDSFETMLDIEGFEAPFPAVFIRAPWVEKVGADIEVLAEVDDHPVLVRKDRVLASSFHPELTLDTRLHDAFLEMVP